MKLVTRGSRRNNKVQIMKTKAHKAVGVCRAIKTLLLVGGVALAYCSSTNAAIVSGSNIAIAPTNQVIVEGSAVTVSASFTETAPTNAYFATVNWGDGTIVSNISPTVTAATNIAVSSAHTYLSPASGAFSISVAVLYTNNTGTVTQTLAGETVVDAPLTLVSVLSTNPVAVEGNVTNVTLLTFLDADPLATTNQYALPTITAVSNAGNVYSNANPLIVSAGSTNGGVLFAVQATMEFYSFGSNTFSITVHDTAGTGGNSFTTNSTVVIADANLSLVSTGALAFTEGVIGPTNVLMTFVDGNSLATSGNSLADYVAVVNWGDNTPSQTFSNSTFLGPLQDTVDLVGYPVGQIGIRSVGAATNVFQVYGDHAYPSNGLYFVTVTVNDIGGAAPLIVSAIPDTAADAGLKVVGFGPSLVNEPGYQSLAQSVNNPLGAQLITFADSNEFSRVATILAAPYTEYLATINWGDGTAPTTGVVQDAGTYTLITVNYDSSETTTAEEFYVYGNHTYDAVCTNYTLIVKALDLTGGAYCVATATVIIADAPIEGSGFHINANANSAFSGPVAAFSDPDTALTASSFSATISWGDNTPYTSGTIVSYGNDVYLVTGTHTYVSPTTGDDYENVTVYVADPNLCNTPQSIPSRIYFTTGIGFVTNGVPATDVVATDVAFCTNVATFTDSALPPGLMNDLSAVINWGDGFVSDGTIATNAAGQYVISGCHTYLDDGVWNVTVSVSDLSQPTADDPPITSGTVITFISEASYTDLTADMEVLFGNVKILHEKSAGKSESVDYYYSEMVTLENTSGTTLTGPFGLVLQTDEFGDNNINLLNITGQLADGREYVPLSTDTLKPKGKLKVTLQWSAQDRLAKGPVILPVRLIAGPGL
ncbi:MAG: hypothetical protein ABSA12_10110 [Verrucomicrobiia bacterium]|jgi:hypothetical protein